MQNNMGLRYGLGDGTIIARLTPRCMRAMLNLRDARRFIYPTMRYRAVLRF